MSNVLELNGMVARITYSVLLVNCGFACPNGRLFHRATNNATTIVIACDIRATRRRPAKWIRTRLLQESPFVQFFERLL